VFLFLIECVASGLRLVWFWFSNNQLGTASVCDWKREAPALVDKWIALVRLSVLFATLTRSLPSPFGAPRRLSPYSCPPPACPPSHARMYNCSSDAWLLAHIIRGWMSEGKGAAKGRAFRRDESLETLRPLVPSEGWVSPSCVCLCRAGEGSEEAWPSAQTSSGC